MKKAFILSSLAVLSLASLASCGGRDTSKVITVCASESPHALILNNAVKPLLEEKGYRLEVTVLDWTLQNDAVLNGDYDANYFQHRPYLQQYETNKDNYSETYTYTKVFPTALVHYEPLRIYAGKAKAADFEKNKKTATYEICSDSSNEIRALELLKVNGVIDSYEVDESGTPLNENGTVKGHKNIHLIDEAMLSAQLEDYDYAALPCNTALTANLTADDTLPVEDSSVAELRANVIAANVESYKKDEAYKAKIDALTEAVLDESVASYIKSTWNGVIATYQKSLL